MARSNALAPTVRRPEDWLPPVPVIAAASTASAGQILISIEDMPLADPAKPLIRWRFKTAVTFIAGHTADAAIAATSTSALLIKKNGAANGTVSFTGTTGTVTFTDSAYAAGDLFELYPPATIDATLDEISVTFVTD